MYEKSKCRDDKKSFDVETLFALLRLSDLGKCPIPWHCCVTWGLNLEAPFSLIFTNHLIALFFDTTLATLSLSKNVSHHSYPLLPSRQLVLTIIESCRCQIYRYLNLEVIARHLSLSLVHRLPKVPRNVNRQRPP